MSSVISMYLICMLNFIRVCAKDMELGVTYVLRILVFSCSTLRRSFTIF